MTAKQTSAICEALEEMINRAHPFAELVGTKWADRQGLSQETYWLNVARDEAIAALRGARKKAAPNV